MTLSLSRQLFSLLGCPSCIGRPRLKLGESFGKKIFYCGECKRAYPIRNVKFQGNLSFETPFLYPFIESFAKDFKETNGEFLNEIIVKEENPRYCYNAEIANNLVLEHLSGKENSLIIDNGCGHKGLQRLINLRIHGIEYNFGKSAYAPVDPISPIDFYANSEYLPLRDGCVDFFISNFVLEHVKQQQLYLNEMYRTLKKDGEVLISFPTPKWYLAHFISIGTQVGYIKEALRDKKFYRDPIRYALGKNAHGWNNNFIEEMTKLWKPERYEKMFINAGFKIANKSRNGNIFSLYIRYDGLARSLKDDKNGIQVSYILKK
ncbi:MAG: methyltransferase domain-containing protein [Candidatus Nanoarchaeia archaeon]|nr:methyltransferase domain-containing protein [Candidatus Nanoarchaeia archaeon]